MAIKYRPSTEPTLAAASGTAVGKAEAKKREQEIDWQRESEIRANALNTQLQEQEIQRRFLNQQRSEQLAYEKEQRAREWELEKATIRSRLDFEEGEKDRQKKHQQLLNQLTEVKTKRIEQNLPDDVYDSILVDIAKNYEDDGFTEADSILGMEALRKRQERENEIAERKRLAAIVGTEIAPLLPIDELRKQAYEVIGRTGQTASVPVENQTTNVAATTANLPDPLGLR